MSAHLSPISSPAKQGKHVVVVGCGNIGSFLVLLLVRMMEIVKLTLVDFDRYDKTNFFSQHISPADFGRTKAGALARLARRLNPQLEVVPLVARVEGVPPGKLRGDLMLACLDSKDARRCTSEIAWHLGMPLVDAGIEASALLARVNVYLPALNQPCLECAWDQCDYAQLFVKHPCDGSGSAAPPTGAPASLGALAASLQAIECGKILTGDFSGAGRQVLIEAATHKHFVTAFRRNPSCRFSHEQWKLSKLQVVPSNLSLREALQLSGRGQASLAFAGMQLARQLACPGCGFTRRVFRLEQRLSRPVKLCPRCGRELLAQGFHSLARLSINDVSGGIGAHPLASLGLREGDIISVSCDKSERIFELGPARGARTLPHQLFNRRMP